ncbi:DUF979 domain-containing protein [Hutsoniella sourekii]|uniref:DUF979 domain-containing protein n=1 Tax=Hutsoniella sourekii TaxID=87650 RepID=UPI0004889DF9|nr:DUF979 domain-containing protein [Hutsoniella sourekii]
MAQYTNLILEIIFIVIGAQLIYTAYQSITDSTNPKRIGTSLFWGILGFIFIAGPYIPSALTGLLIFVLGGLTLFKQVEIGQIKQVSEEEQTARGNRYGNWVFLPVILIGATSIIVSALLPSLSSAVLGFGGLVATIAMVILVKPSGQEFLAESDRMVQQVSTTGILPQLLAAVGAVFTAAGVGEVIAQIISGVIPADSRLWGVIAYVLGMVIFTMIMGNAFAAFAVITVGIGIPFVFNQGADPAIASALAMTAGFCGTLMTPMAGNFNALPAALLEMKSPYSVIIQQIPVALVMILAHIVLMYMWAF